MLAVLHKVSQVNLLVAKDRLCRPVIFLCKKCQDSIATTQ